MHTKVRITNLENGRSVTLRVNDRGPFVSGRIVDLSLYGAKFLGIYGRGTARVRLQVDGEVPGMVRARATLTLVREVVADLGGQPFALRAPTRFCGELFGHGGELAPAYAALGLVRERVRFEPRESFLIEPLAI